MKQVVNCNFSNMKCVLLKLVSGEEIITHVDPKMLEAKRNPSLVLHDPFQIKLERGQISMTLWMIGSSHNEVVIDKQDIMVRSEPDSHYEHVYDRLLEEKYNSMEPDEESVMESYGNRFIISGTDTIN